MLILLLYWELLLYKPRQAMVLLHSVWNSRWCICNDRLLDPLRRVAPRLHWEGVLSPNQPVFSPSLLLKARLCECTSWRNLSILLIWGPLQRDWNWETDERNAKHLRQLWGEADFGVELLLKLEEDPWEAIHTVFDTGKLHWRQD